MGKVKIHNGWIIGTDVRDGTKNRIRASMVDSYAIEVTDDGQPCDPYCAVYVCDGCYWLDPGALEELDRYFGEARNA